MTITNYSTAAFLINPDIRAVSVTYEKDTDTKRAARYTFKTFDKDIKAGDYVIVPTSTRHGMTVVKVDAVDIGVDLETEHEIKWVVAKFDDTPYRKAKVWEEQAVEKIKFAQAHKKREELKKALEDSINGAMGEIKALPFIE